MKTQALKLMTVGTMLLCMSCAPVDMPPYTQEQDNSNDRLPTRNPDRSLDRTKRKPPTPAQLETLKVRVKAALDHVKKRDLETNHSSWTVFHGILGVGLELELVDSFTRERVNAVDYILSGGKVPGLEFLYTEHGLDVRTGPPHLGQGHQDQYVAEIAQLGLPLDRELIVRGKKHKFAELVNHAKMRASTKKRQELSWTLVVLSQYYGTDFSWTNEDGDKLHFDDLVRYELNEPIDDAACGGTHRLFGLTWAYYTHRKNGGKQTDLWKKVAAKIQEYQNAARRFQNTDGSFSTQYLSRAENLQEAQRRINTTGHVLEWLALSLPKEELTAPWMQDAASALSLMILKNKKSAIESGGLYHAAHGLTMYYARVFGGEKAKVLPPPPKDD